MKTIAAVSVSRADYGILRPLVRTLSGPFTVRLIVAGSHLAEHAESQSEIDRDGWTAAALVRSLPEGDTPRDIARALGAGVMGFADAYAQVRPDFVLVIGDRFETLAAAAAAITSDAVLCHVHGGELSEGAIDESMRHAITKLSHLHFVAGVAQARRVLQMGEEPWRVVVSGAPVLDYLRDVALLPRADLEARLGLQFTEAPLLVTYHPETIDHAASASHVEELVQALTAFPRPVIVTAPNVDTANIAVRRRLQQWVTSRSNAVFVETLGTDAYWSAMAISGALVGNSSSGIIEAASFRLPVVDVGRRQRGRDRERNVIHADNNRQSIGDAIRRALAPDFRESLTDLVNPYGDGHAATRILQTLVSLPPTITLKAKRFHQLSQAHT